MGVPIFGMNFDLAPLNARVAYYSIKSVLYFDSEILG